MNDLTLVRIAMTKYNRSYTFRDDLWGDHDSFIEAFDAVANVPQEERKYKNFYDLMNKQQWQSLQACVQYTKRKVKEAGGITEILTMLKERKETREKKEEETEKKIAMAEEHGCAVWDYDAFLLSDYWWKLRAEAITKAENKCQICNCPNSLQVHHRTYKRHWTEEEHLDLITVCHPCHEMIHSHYKIS